MSRGLTIRPSRTAVDSRPQPSEFTPFSNFGAMVAVATAGSTVGSILLLPACLTLGERWSRARSKTPAVAEVGG